MQCMSWDKVKSKAPNLSSKWVFGPLNYQTIVTVGQNSLPHYGALFFLSRHDVTSFIYSTKWPCTEMLEKWLTLKTVQRPEAPQGYGALNKIHDPNILWHNLIMLMIIVLISETLTVAMWTKSAKPSNIFSSSFRILKKPCNFGHCWLPFQPGHASKRFFPTNWKFGYHLI